jgi:hypothetical protein
VTWADASGWQMVSFCLHLFAALGCAGLALLLAGRGEHDRPDRIGTLAALALTAVWAVVTAALGPESTLAIISESARDVAWLNVLYRLFAIDGRHTSLRPIRPVIGALAFVEALQLLLPLIRAEFAGDPVVIGMTLEIQAVFNMLVAIGALVLLHNLYVGASKAAQQVLRWSATGLAALWIYDLNLYTVAYLGGGVTELRALHGLIVLGTIAGIGLGSRASRCW